MVKCSELGNLPTTLTASMSLYPYAGAHAVQSAAFALEWPSELTESELSAVAGVHEKIKGSLPNLAPIHTLMVQLSGNQPVSTSSSPAGYVFSRGGPAGPVRAVEVHRNRIVGQVNDYTRWKPVWKEVKSWFEALAPHIGKRPISTIGLQYNDVFYWRDSPQTLDLGAVFREDTSLLPRNVFELKGLWHSHHGYFLDCEEPMHHRLLENVNVGMLEELGQRSIVISTVHKAEVANIWGWESLTKIIDPLMASLHARNKETLGKLLSPSAADMISLFKETK